MKIKTAICLLFIVSAAVLLCGCENEYTGVVDVYELAQHISTCTPFKEELVILPDTSVSTLYSINGAVKTVVYSGSGAYSDEIIVTESADIAGAKTAETSLYAYLEKQLDRFLTYKPSEIKKLKKPVIVRFGKYCVYCIAPSHKTVLAYVENYFDGADVN